MKKTTLLIFAVFLICNNVKSQVLYSENFDNLTVGDLSNDKTGQTPGQGGWYVVIPSNNMDIRVISEPGRGNVVGFGWLNGQTTTGYGVGLKNLSSLWNVRTSGNDIFKMEFDLYIKNINFQSSNFTFVAIAGGLANNAMSQIYCRILNNAMVTGGGGTHSGNHTPYKYTWIKIEVLHDYNTFKTYYHIPSLNFLLEHDFNKKVLPDSIIETLGMILSLKNITYSDAVVKIDNFKISAIPTLPTFLGVNDFVSQKFNLYPNPATDIVNITNNENLSINQVDIYDLSGKLINTQTFNNEVEIQLNLEKLVTGTYLLHLQTNEGIAIKKLVKR